MTPTPGRDAPACAALDAAGVEALYRSLGPRLYQYIRRQVAHPATAGDLLQDVFVRLLKTPIEIRSEAETRSYLYRIASSVVAEHYRTERLLHSVPAVRLEVEGDDSSDGAFEVAATKPALDKAMRELTLRDRTLLWLAYVEDMPHAEIAASLGLRTASIKVLLFRARKRLAAKLQSIERETKETL